MGSETMNNMKKIMSDNNFSFKKKYGQNFLIDDNILNKIIDSSNIEDDTLVIEIGVGAGNLTKKIALVAKRVIGYEIDTKLKSIIEDNLKEHSNIDIIYDDFLTREVRQDIKNIIHKHCIVIANLPYYITTPIITKLIEENIDIDKMIIMVQKEVATRLSAKPDSKDYNSLTVFLNYYFDIKKLFDVSSNAFLPKPNVDSSIVLLNRKESQVLLKDEKLFFKLVRDSFKFKRKTLKNNLKGYDLSKIEDVLAKHGLSLTVRAEHLTLEQFADIANSL